MFSVESVRHSLHWGPNVTITHDALGLTVQAIPRSWPLFKLVHLRTPSPSATDIWWPQSMYGWQVGGTHPTEMLSCKSLWLLRVFLSWERKVVSQRRNTGNRYSCVYFPLMVLSTAIMKVSCQLFNVIYENDWELLLTFFRRSSAAKQRKIMNSLPFPVTVIK